MQEIFSIKTNYHQEKESENLKHNILERFSQRQEGTNRTLLALVQKTLICPKLY